MHDLSLSEKFSGKKILVTGARGYIGPHLCRRLIRYGAEVCAVSRKTSDVDHESLQWWEADLTAIEVVRKLIDAVRPDIIFHLAGCAAGGREIELVLPTFQSNLTTTVNVLTAATDTGCRRIIIPGSLEEPDACGAEVVPSSPYAAGKWAGSAYARMFFRLYKTPVVILRLFMTYGPGRQSLRKLIPSLIISLLQGQSPKLSSGEREIDWIYIDDVIDGLLAAAVAREVEGATIDVGSGMLVSIRSLVEQLLKVMHSDVCPEFGALGDRPMEQVRVANITETFSKIGWMHRTPLEEGLQKTVTWYKEHVHELGKFTG